MGRGFWRKPKWLKKLAKSPDDVTVLADVSDQAADKSTPLALVLLLFALQVAHCMYASVAEPLN